MITYLSGPNGMYLVLDHIAYQAMARSRREAASGWAERASAGRRARGCRRTDCRAVLFLLGAALIALLFILGWG